jgi:uncharacterized protein YjbJ (UPF0337 family)
MGFWDKLKNKTQRAKGHGKERVGRETGDPYLETKGQAERVKGGAKQVGEQVKDAGKEVRKTFD